MIFVALFVLYPIMSIIIGINYIDSCNIETAIPVWLIVNGVSIFLLGFSVTILKYFNITILIAFICLFLFSWLIKGKAKRLNLIIQRILDNRAINFVPEKLSRLE